MDNVSALLSYPQFPQPRGKKADLDVTAGDGRRERR